MEGRINGEGIQLFKWGKWVTQYCPFDDSSICGIRCPHFGEPVKKVSTSVNRTKHTWAYAIEICHGKTLIMENTEYWRKKIEQ
jgi:hypothetical protein